MPNPANEKPGAAGTADRVWIAQQNSPPDSTAMGAATSTNSRRCPWFNEVIERAARPGAWHAHAIIHCGSGAWDRARDTHDVGRRACTLLPPESDPAAVRWPAIKNWVGNAGDLPTASAIELARVLIDAGAELVQMVGDNIKPSLTVRRARNGA